MPPPPATASCSPESRPIGAIPIAATTTAARSFGAAARKLGMDEAMLGELLAVVGMFNQTNRLATGTRVEVDEVYLTLPEPAAKPKARTPVKAAVKRAAKGATRATRRQTA